MQQHPKALKVFFLTEMWERYGFYVIQTLLAIYLAAHFSWSDKKIYTLVGSFTALNYLTPFLGGVIADKWLGQNSCIILGGFILLLSYVLLGLSPNMKINIYALASIAIGTGLLKPNIASLLGKQYEKNIEERENGFTLFYMGITTGIILGTLLPSYIKDIFGWRLAFLSAAFGLIFALFAFITGIRKYHISTKTKHHNLPAAITLSTLLILGLFSLNVVLLNHENFADFCFPITGLIAIMFLIQCIFRESSLQRKKTFLILILCAISTFFWAFYFQMFSALTLFIIRIVNHNLFGYVFPAPYYVAVESIGMIVIGLFITRFKNITTALGILKKFIFALIMMLISYLIIDGLCLMSSLDSKISPLLLFPAYLCISLAELLISPVGTSAMTFLASKENVSTMTGIFFVSLGIGGYLSGKLAKLTAIPEALHNLAQIKNLYAYSFGTQIQILLIGIIITFIIFGFVQFYFKKND